MSLLPAIPPTYPYQRYIYTPTRLGSSTAGNLDTLKRDINILGAYTRVLMEGESRNGQLSAQPVSPLGNKYFINTGSTCEDSNKKKQSRFIYMNNVPDGTGVLYGKKGLVAGVLENVESMNPMALFKAFEKKTACQEVTMSVRDNNNVTGIEKHFVNESDIKDYNACWFADNRNPVTKESCRQGMTGTDDWLLRVYFTGVGAVGVYLLYHLLYKKKYR